MTENAMGEIHIVFRLKYMNNVCHENIGVFTFISNDKQDFIPFVHDCLRSNGYPFDENKGMLYLVGEEWVVLCESVLEGIDKHSEVKLVYSEVCALCYARNVAEYKGIIFFFHTDEQNHQGFPHVHASNSGDEISIDIRTATVCAGKFKSITKQKIALEYVKAHRAIFVDGWQEWAAK